MEKILPIGEYIEKGINSLEQNLSFLWGAIDDGISWTVENLNDLLLAVPFVVFLVIVALAAYYAKAKGKFFIKEGLKKGFGLTLFVILGFFLIYGMGYWEEAVQTTTLVLVSTLIALIIGIPFGILSAKSGKIHFTPLAIITAEAVLTKHIALQDRNSQRPESGYGYLAKHFMAEINDLRFYLYRRSQALSREVAQIRDNADCFWKPQKYAISNSWLL